MWRHRSARLLQHDHPDDVRRLAQVQRVQKETCALASPAHSMSASSSYNGSGARPQPTAELRGFQIPTFTEMPALSPSSSQARYEQLKVRTDRIEQVIVGLYQQINTEIF